MLPVADDVRCRLDLFIHGTGDAAANWAEYTEKLLSLGFTVGKATPCAFYRAQRGLTACVHGDDFVFAGMPSKFNRMRAKIVEMYELKVETLGPD